MPNEEESLVSNERFGSVLTVCLMAAFLTLLAGPAFAQEEEEAPQRNWSNSTDLSWVLVKGNADTNTFQVRNVYKYKWTKSEITWEAGILRAGSRDDIYAVGSEEDFEVVDPAVELDNNRMYSKLRFMRTLNDRFFWYVSSDNARDEPTSINSQFIASLGVGNTWAERERLVFRTTYGANYTKEDLDLEGANDFAGYRFFYRLESGITESTKIESELTFDGSFEVGNDIRLDSLNGVTVSITDTIALKASLRLLYRNIPALEDIDLEDPDFGIVIGEVIVPKEKLDSIFATSLVINF
jgi:putative salt-induced outer membrane protein YdiY